MGRKTWDSLPKKPLPNRINIVISSNKNIKLSDEVKICNSVEDAVEYCKQFEEVFIIGGQKLYRQFFPIANKLYLTKVHHKFDTDTKLEGLNMNEWTILEEKLNPPNDSRFYAFSFLVCEKK